MRLRDFSLILWIPWYVLLLVMIVLIGTTDGHMIMSWPLSRGYVKNYKYKPVDYDLMAPMKSFKYCKGKQPGESVLTVYPGQWIDVSFTGSARHGGGLCQFALSYDSDNSFKLIATYKHACPNTAYRWPVQIPEDAPPCEKCTFAWSWVNAIGNREFYMDCADITILQKNSMVQSNTAGPCGQQMAVFNLPGFPTLTPPTGSGGPLRSTYTPYRLAC